MASLNQTIVLNTDLFPLGAAINKSFQKTSTINGNSTIFGTVSLDPALQEIQEIQVGSIDDRALLFLQADAANVNGIEIGMYEGMLVTTRVAKLDDSSLLSGTLYTTATGVATTAVPAGGTGLTVDITVNPSGAVTGVVINEEGVGYNVGDVITIAQVSSGLDATIEVLELAEDPIYTTISELKAGELALFPLKYVPKVAAPNAKLAVRLSTYTGSSEQKINFALLETA
jgi:hypothetical protein